jgi:molecular chaperone GrpE
LKSSVPLQLKRRKKYRLRRRQYTAKPEASGGVAGPDLQPRIGQLEKELEELRTALAESEERLIRSRSDLENQRRRYLREKDELRRFATEDLMRSIVPAMDHFGLALQSLENAVDVSSVRQGVTMIHRELQAVLEQAGLKAIVPDVVPFDPHIHEAVGMDHDSTKPDNHVLEVMRSGWALNGRVLRPALVRVNKLAPTNAEDTVVEI